MDAHTDRGSACLGASGLVAVCAGVVGRAFRERLRDDVDLDELRPHLERAARRTVEPEQVSVWLAGHTAREAASR